MSLKNQLTTADYLEYEEFKRLLKELRKDEEYIWEMLARVSFCSALRISDVLKLRWSNILHKDRITITEQKTSKTREIKLSPATQQSFLELYDLLGRPNVHSYIFANQSTGRPVTSMWINRKLKTFRVRYHLNIEHFSTHTFRKTFGRYVYEKYNKSHEGLVLLGRLLNHSNVVTTIAYIGITKDRADSLYDSIVI